MSSAHRPPRDRRQLCIKPTSFLVTSFFLVFVGTYFVTKPPSVKMLVCHMLFYLFKKIFLLSS